MTTIGAEELLVDSGVFGNLDVRWGSAGSLQSGLATALATAISVSVQAGVPPVHLVDELLDLRFTPDGRTDDPDIPHTRSIADYLARRIALDWLTEADRHKLGLSPARTWPDAYISPASGTAG